jgi:uncharacterized membrane protein HdeD (DUF308 family)
MTSPGARAADGPLPGLPAARGTLRLTVAGAAAMLALGLLLLFWPNDSLDVTGVLTGAAILVTGALRLVHAGAAGGEAGAHRSWNVLIAILAVLAGICCLGDIEATVLLSLVVGLFWAMHGLVDLVVASSPGPGRVLTGTTGALSLLAGLIVIFWPAVTVPVLAAVMGTWLACGGILLAATALYLRHVAASAESTLATTAVPGRAARRAGAPRAAALDHEQRGRGLTAGPAGAPGRSRPCGTGRPACGTPSAGGS